VVVILGPPNAGKSTLFNRLMCKEANRSYRLNSEKTRGNRANKNTITSKSRVGYNNPTHRIDGAIVSPIPGTTRDRRECIGRIGDVVFTLIDTAGVDGERLVQLQSTKKQNNHADKLLQQQRWLEKACMEQTLEAAKTADLIFLMFDARAGITSDLLEITRWLRKMGFSHNKQEPEKIAQRKAVAILANKLEGDRWSIDSDSPVLEHLAEVSRCGFGEAIPISAEHGEGLADLAVMIASMTTQKRLRMRQDEHTLHDEELKTDAGDGDMTNKPLTIAILGRQNVGKSTLVNSLLKQNRVITGAMPGLTRDSIAIHWIWEGKQVQIADTAGIRRVAQRNHDDNIEDAAVQDAMRAMKKADVAVLVLDAEAQMLQRQELAIASAVVREGRSLVVAANKMDLLIDNQYKPEDFARQVQEQIESRFPMLRKTPVVAMSSLTGENVDDLMPVVFNARDRWSRTITTGILNSWLAEVIASHPPPNEKGRPTKIKYIMQTKGRPPTFLLFSNQDSLPESYLRYLTRSFQDTFEMYGMEVRLAIKRSASSNPFDSGKRRHGRGVGGKEGRKQRAIETLKSTGTLSTKKRRRFRYTSRRFN